MIRNILYGLLFGMSCLIPGFSGGTMLVILGIYNSITSYLAKAFTKPLYVIRKLFWFMIGSIFGIIISSIVLSDAIKDYPLITGCFFVGLVVGTIFIIFKNLNVFKMNIIDIMFYFIFLVLGMYLTLFANNHININLNNQLNIYQIIYLLFTSIISSAVMIIPAASGMSILLIMGLYDDVMMLIEEVFLGIIHLNYIPIKNNLVFIVIFIVGMIIGIVLISKIISYTLNKKPSIIWSSVLGLLVVSIISIYNDIFTNRIKEINNISISSNIIGSIIAFVVGVLLIYLMNKRKK